MDINLHTAMQRYTELAVRRPFDLQLFAEGGPPPTDPPPQDPPNDPPQDPPKDPPADPVPPVDPLNSKPTDPPTDPPPQDPPVYDFKLPETFSITDEVKGEFTGLLTEAKVAPEMAQKFVDMHIKSVNNVVQAFVDAQVAEIDGWKTDAVKQMGVNQALYEQQAALALNTFGDDEIRKAFQETGLGNKFAFIKFFAGIGKALGEGQIKKGTPSKSLSWAESMYGDKIPK